MKRQVLFIQGGGAGVHDSWDDKLAASLAGGLGADYEVHYPFMPREEDPHYAAWKARIEQEFGALDERAILVGHSIGAAILVNVLAEQPGERRFGAVLLIAAPFVGDDGWPSDELKTVHDLGTRLPRGMPVHIYHGLADETAPPSHADLYARAIPQAHVHRLPGRDHQFNDDLGIVAADIRSFDRVA